MSAGDLVQLLETWSDALLMSEFITSPYLQVGDQWDLRDWTVEDLAEGFRFERFDPRGHLSDVVVVVDVAESERHRYEAALAWSEVPTWLVLVGERQAEWSRLETVPAWTSGARRRGPAAGRLAVSYFPAGC